MKTTRTLILSTFLLLISGCGLFQQKEPEVEIRVVTKPAEFKIYHPYLPPEVSLRDVEWDVITPENLEEKVKEYERKDGNFVVYAITPEEYEDIAYNLQELRRFILQQKAIILYYRNIDVSDKQQ